MTEPAQRLIDAYKFVDGVPLKERKHWLQDDYVKFIRLAQIILEDSGMGVAGLITNHGYLDNPTFRGMRQSILASFSALNLYDLHGSAKKIGVIPKSVHDKNVFDIQQGVAIITATQLSGTNKRVFHAHLWGTREHKYNELKTVSVNRVEWSAIHPHSPYYFFVPKSLDFQSEYQSGCSITEVMPIYVNGIVTARDAFAIDFEDGPIKKRVREFLNERLSDKDVMRKLDLSENYAWRVKDARRRLRSCTGWARNITNILYRPFDIRRIIYHDAVVWRTRSKVMKQMLIGNNLGLCTNRQVNDVFRHAGVTRHLINDCTLSLATKERTYIFPLWVYPDHAASGFLDEAAVRPNFGKDFLKTLSSKLQLPQSRMYGLPQGLIPEEILQYAYAVLHSPGYRSRYIEFLKIDFPRLPITSSLELFRALACLGGELASLHLVEAPVQQALSAHYAKTEAAWCCEVAKGQSIPLTLSFTGPAEPAIRQIGWSDETVWIDAVKPKKGAADAKVTGTVGFRGVPEEVWNFHIGGYQVCEKWLKDRRGRILTAEDITHYHRIVIALHETIRIMREIDEVIDAHGGWPDAFRSTGGKKGGASKLTEGEPDEELVSAQAARARRGR